MSVIDPEVLKGLRDADRPEEFRGLFDRFLRVRFHAVRGVEPEDIHAILREARRDNRGVRFQRIRHPVRGDDRKADTVRNVVPGRNLMLNPVAGPGGRRAAKPKEPAAAKGRRGEHFAPGLKVCGIFEGNRTEMHHGLQHGFAEAIRNH